MNLTTSEFDRGDEMHAWWTRARPSADPALLSRLMSRLTESERARYQRFKVTHAADQYLVGRGVLRQLLGQYLGQPAEAISLAETDAGKPFLTDERLASSSAAGGPEAGGGLAPLQFNVSHKPDLIAFAFVRGLPIGVDVEALEPRSATAGIAEHYFSEPEIRLMEQVEGKEYVRRFYRFWTLKEAYVKARGLGLQLPLHDFWFSFADPFAPDHPPETIRVGFAEKLDEDPRDWQFHSCLVGDAHRLSLALRRGRRPNLPLTISELPSHLL